MNKDMLLQTSEIVSHANCPDGIGAAMVATAAYVAGGMSPPPTYFVQYGTRAHDEMQARPRQLFVDITPPKGRWEEWRGMSPIVLDHHESAMHVTQSLNGAYGDGDHSGTMLAFEHVMLPLATDFMSESDLGAWGRFAHLCMVRDTWKVASPDWAEACALAHALLLHGQKWGIAAATAGELPIVELLAIGRKLHDKILRQSKGVVRNSLKRTLSIGGRDIKIAFFNHAEGGTLSDIAHYVMDEMPCDAVVGYFYIYEDDDTRCVVSVRTDGCVSASDLARSFGGGGHAKAAGFRIAGDVSPNVVVQTVCDRLTEANMGR
jgi:hypothetical protein